MHIAATLDVPTIALFGPTNPASILPSGTAVASMYEEQLTCQPCWSPHCTQKEVYCMKLLTTDAVELKIRTLLYRN
jgi:ADP-heptose:LPS heptosyltransferase